jgi:hypothetical protein
MCRCISGLYSSTHRFGRHKRYGPFTAKDTDFNPSFPIKDTAP